MTDQAWYVYGIVAADDVASVDDLSVVSTNGVESVTYDDVAALVAPIDPSRSFGRRADLVAHSDVLNGIAAVGVPVVPVAFGSVLGDLSDVRNSFLADNADYWAQLVAGLRGRAQYTLRATYREQAVLAEVVRANPEITRLHELTATSPDDADIGARVRLGELVAHALDDLRARDIDQLTGPLMPHAEAHRVTVGTGTDGLADAAFLVDDGQRDAFESAAEELAERLHERVRLRLLGPLAAFDFVQQEPAWAS